MSRDILTNSPSDVKTTYSYILTKLRNHKRIGRIDYFTCPCHNDVNRSLVMTEGRTGTPILFCHAGCHTEDILAHIGLKFSDLYGNLNQATIEDVYDYQNKNGELIYQVIRYPSKQFSVRRLTTNGEWINGLENTKRVLYHLPQIINSSKDEIIFICEGEKDADNLAKLGAITTTNPFGTGKWKNEYNQYFQDRLVCILPDNDKAGSQHSEKVCLNIKPVAKSVKIINLPGLAVKEDVTDWLNQGGTLTDLLDLYANTSEYQTPQVRKTYVRNILPYANSILRTQLQYLEWTKDKDRQTRFSQLNTSSFICGQNLAINVFEDRQAIEYALLDMAMQINLQVEESLKTIQAGIESGIANPNKNIVLPHFRYPIETLFGYKLDKRIGLYSYLKEFINRDSGIRLKDNGEIYKVHVWATLDRYYNQGYLATARHHSSLAGIFGVSRQRIETMISQLIEAEYIKLIDTVETFEWRGNIFKPIQIWSFGEWSENDKGEIIESLYIDHLPPNNLT